MGRGTMSNPAPVFLAHSLCPSPGLLMLPTSPDQEGVQEAQCFGRQGVSW